MLYRRRTWSDTWHWTLSCRWWPWSGDPIVERRTKPRHGEFCNECLAKEKRAHRRA